MYIYRIVIETMTSHDMKKVEQLLKLRDIQQMQQVNQLRKIIRKLKNEKKILEGERSQLGIEIQGLILEVKSLKNEYMKLKKDDGSKINNHDVMMKTTNSHLLNIINELEKEKEKLEGTIQNLFDYTPSSPLTPQKSKITRKRNSPVKEPRRKSMRLNQKKKNKKTHHVRGRRSMRELSFQK